ncbi:MAG: IS5 family transposase [Alphaproteobacteria bacterium]|nr:IS5 family transposase [Alphaproteobacteria bacterium]
MLQEGARITKTTGLEQKPAELHVVRSVRGTVRLTDDAGRPVAFTLTPGQAHDLVGVGALLKRIPAPRRLIADRAYDARRLRDWLTERGCEPVIPPNPTRKNPHSFDAAAYKLRNRIERMFCRLKDFRRIATRYDKRADTFLSAVFIAAILAWWAN